MQFVCFDDMLLLWKNEPSIYSRNILLNFQILWESDHKTRNYRFLKILLRKNADVIKFFKKIFSGTCLSYWYALIVKKWTLYLFYKNFKRILKISILWESDHDIENCRYPPQNIYNFCFRGTMGLKFAQNMQN